MPLERFADLPLPLCCLLPRPLLLDAPGGSFDRETAELVRLGPNPDSSGVSIVGVSVRVVLGASLAPTEPPHRREPSTRDGLLIDGGEVRNAIGLGLHDERRGDLGAHGLGLRLGGGHFGGVLVVLGAVHCTLGITARSAGHVPSP